MVSDVHSNYHRGRIDGVVRCVGERDRVTVREPGSPTLVAAVRFVRQGPSRYETTFTLEWVE